MVPRAGVQTGQGVKARSNTMPLAAMAEVPGLEMKRLP